jgi:peptide-methionine (S)-S-oxide reductase
MEKATFGAGCFWGVEEVYRKLEGVLETRVGYMGGAAENPTYEQVCGGQTGHAEVCEVCFDSAVVSYRQLLEVFWEMHDPTQVNRQGPDAGQQYRSIVFYGSAEQQAEAEQSKAKLESSGSYQGPLATSIEKLAEFWLAEEHHQRYFERNGGGSCHLPSR